MSFVDNSAQIMAQTTFSDSDFISAAGPFGKDAASAFIASSSVVKGDPPAELAPPPAAAAAPAAEGAAPADGAASAKAAPEPAPRDLNIYEKAGVQHFERGHKIFGHPVFKAMMDKYLPYHADQDDGVKWVMGWHEIHPIEYNDWDNEVKGAITATEGYYPRSEDEEERKFAVLTNASEHNKAKSLDRAIKAHEEAEAAKKAAEEEAGGAEGEAAAGDAAGAPADGAATAPAASAAALAAKPALFQGNGAYDLTASFNMLAQGHITSDFGVAGDVDSSEYDQDKEMEIHI
jgi:hypothetical protein